MHKMEAEEKEVVLQYAREYSIQDKVHTETAV
jgi:hypothetical protein